MRIARLLAAVFVVLAVAVPSASAHKLTNQRAINLMWYITKVDARESDATTYNAFCTKPVRPHGGAASKSSHTPRRG